MIHEQLRRAASGDKQGVKKLQSDTGVKDKIAQHWINTLVEKATVMMKTRCTDPKTKDKKLKAKISPEERKQIKGNIGEGVQEELINWLVQQPEGSYDQIQSGMFDVVLPRT